MLTTLYARCFIDTLLFLTKYLDTLTMYSLIKVNCDKIKNCLILSQSLSAISIHRQYLMKTYYVPHGCIITLKFHTA